MPSPFGIADKVHVTKGADKVGGYRKTPQIERKWCTVCGGHLLTNIHSLELVNIYAPVLPTLPFVPNVHVRYQETVLPMKDGLPKQRDFPRSLAVQVLLCRNRSWFRI